MKKLVLIVTAFLGLSAGSASATCTGPAVMHDFPGTAFNMSLATAPDGNCASNNAITTWGGVTLGAASNYGTSPGAVEVMGVNAFVTNTVAVSGTFWPYTLGQQVSASSVPVVLPAAQITTLTPPTSVAVNNFPATQPVSVASGGIASGAGTDGWDSTKGAKTDAPATLPTSTTSASGISIWKAIANALNSLLSAATTPLDNTSVPINVSSSTTTQLVALSGSTLVRITSYDVMAGGTGTFQLVYGTGTNCATGQNPLTGAYPLTAQAGIAKGSGIGTILKTPAGQAVCAVTVGVVQYSGSLSFQQF